MKILIAVPTFETITPECFKAIYDLDKGEHQVDFDFIKGYDCAEARNRIAELALAGCYDYVLMVDSDTIIPRDTLTTMLEDPVRICLGVCPKKNTKDGQTALCKMESRYFNDCWYYHELPEERFEVKVGGFACALIDVTVLRDTTKPWFRYAVFDDGSIMSEDFYFCNNASAWYGIPVYADPRVKCGHLARYFQYE